MTDELKQWLIAEHEEAIHRFNEQTAGDGDHNGYTMAFWNGAAVALKKVLESCP